MQEPDPITVFISSRESTCDECGAALGRKAWITEEECLADKDIRERRRQREEERRTELDREYIWRFAQRIREIFPHCRSGREDQIAEHACLKYSGRVGRSLAAKALDGEAVRLAVTAHVRHHETQYDTLLAKGEDRYEARRNVPEAIDDILESWS